jgi:UDP-glucuronate 4-epimerase
LKGGRAARLEGRDGFRMVRIDIAEHEALAELGEISGAKRVVHLAAQAGVRYSIENPFAYERSNLAGHLAVLEACRHAEVEHLVYASSSSVYGDRPLNGDGFRETDPADEPGLAVRGHQALVRNAEPELRGKLYGFPQSGLRFFTVYGPWGRPDMAYYGFTEKMLKGEPIEVFGEGEMARDFTFIDDIVDGVLGVLDHPPAEGGHEIYNIGDNDPVGLMEMIETLEAALGIEADKVMRPMQPGDVTATFANIDKLNALCGYKPKVKLAEGLARFVEWRRAYTG